MSCHQSRADSCMILDFPLVLCMFPNFDCIFLHFCCSVDFLACICTLRDLWGCLHGNRVNFETSPGVEPRNLEDLPQKDAISKEKQMSSNPYFQEWTLRSEGCTLQKMIGTNGHIWPYEWPTVFASKFLCIRGLGWLHDRMVQSRWPMHHCL